MNRVLYHHRTQGRDVEAVHIRGLAAALEELGCSVEIVGPPGVEADPDSRSSAAAGAAPGPLGWLARRLPQVLFEGMELGYNAVALPRLWLRCRAGRPALIYERYALFNAAGVLAGRLSGTPVVLEVNETARVERTRQGRSLALRSIAGGMERWILSRATGVVVVSGYLRDQLIGLGIPPERIRVTPNAVDAARFDPERVDGREVRSRWGLEGTQVVGFVGSFARWHGVDLLLRAAADLREEYPNLRLLLVGDGSERAAAGRLARELGISERTVFTGRVPHAAVPAHVAAMDIGVMPASNAHGSPVKVFEYMAMGRPPVAPRWEPIKEAIDHGTTGLLFPPGDGTALRDCLRALLADRRYREGLGAAARARVLTRHRWVDNARDVLDLARAGTRRPARGGPAAGRMRT